MTVNRAASGVSQESVTWPVRAACELPLEGGARRAANYGARSAINAVPYWAVQGSSRWAVRDAGDTATFVAVTGVANDR